MVDFYNFSLCFTLVIILLYLFFFFTFKKCLCVYSFILSINVQILVLSMVYNLRRHAFWNFVTYLNSGTPSSWLIFSISPYQFLSTFKIFGTNVSGLSCFSYMNLVILVESVLKSTCGFGISSMELCEECGILQDRR